jgi:hypothetical protein
LPFATILYQRRDADLDADRREKTCPSQSRRLIQPVQKTTRQTRQRLRVPQQLRVRPRHFARSLNPERPYQIFYAANGGKRVA